MWDIFPLMPQSTNSCCSSPERDHQEEMVSLDTRSFRVIDALAKGMLIAGR
jgi:hypothetical protein